MVLRHRKAMDLFYEMSLWALGACLFLIIFERPARAVLTPLFKGLFHIQSEFLFLLSFYVFLIGSFVLVSVVYWIFWSDQRLRSKISLYMSRLVCPDYYGEKRNLKLNAAIGTVLMQAQSRELDIEEDFKHESGSRTDRDALSQATGLEKEIVYNEGDLLVRKVYYGNGNIKTEASFKGDVPEGFCRTYYEDGRLHQEKFYRDGKLEGPFKAYDEDGGLYFVIQYQNNVQHGKDLIYYKNGNVQFEDTYVEGRRINRKTFDQNGQLKFTQDF